MNLLKPSPKLRRKNRIRTVQSSLSIEGNTLTLDQVAALLDEKRIIGPEKDKDYQNIFKSISTATASRDLSYGFENGLLGRIGDKRTAVYRFLK